MKKPRSQEHAALGLLAWSCLDFMLSEALESLATTPAEETSIKRFLGDAANKTNAQTNLSGTLVRVSVSSADLPRMGHIFCV